MLALGHHVRCEPEPSAAFDEHLAVLAPISADRGLFVPVAPALQQGQRRLAFGGASVCADRNLNHFSGYCRPKTEPSERPTPLFFCAAEDYE